MIVRKFAVKRSALYLALAMNLGACGDGGPPVADSTASSSQASGKGVATTTSTATATAAGTTTRASQPTVSVTSVSQAASRTTSSATSPAASSTPARTTVTPSTASTANLQSATGTATTPVRAAPTPVAAPTATPAPVAAPTPAPVAQVAANPLRSRQVRIMCLGDSMTAGGESSSDGFRAYRGRLFLMLRNAGIDVDFIGTSWSMPAVGGDPDHEGYGGAYIGPGGDSNNLWDRLPVALSSSVQPDIIIMAFGWNSVYHEPSLAAGKYQGIVNHIASIKPSAQLVLATLSPQRGESQSQTNNSVAGFLQLNEMARSLANSSSNDKLYLADLANVSYTYSDYWDVIHWLQPGADKAAQVIFNALIAGPLKP